MAGVGDTGDTRRRARGNPMETLGGSLGGFLLAAVFSTYVGGHGKEYLPDTLVSYPSKYSQTCGRSSLECIRNSALENEHDKGFISLPRVRNQRRKIASHYAGAISLSLPLII